MFILIRDSQEYKCEDIVSIIGLDIKFKKYNICIVDSNLKDYIIKDKYLKNFEKLVKNILLFLDEEDEDEAGAELLFNELKREYELFKGKYLKYMSKDMQKKYVRKVRLLANELKKVKNVKKVMGNRFKLR